MVETGGVPEHESHWNEQEWNQRALEQVRLLEQARQERNQIEDGIDTSAAQLDRLLAADSEFFQWCRDNPSPDEDPEDEEDRGRDFLKTLKALNISHAVSIAMFCEFSIRN